MGRIESIKFSDSLTVATRVCLEGGLCCGVLLLADLASLPFAGLPALSLADSCNDCRTVGKDLACSETVAAEVLGVSLATTGVPSSEGAQTLGGAAEIPWPLPMLA